MIHWNECTYKILVQRRYRGKIWNILNLNFYSLGTLVIIVPHWQYCNNVCSIFVFGKCFAGVKTGYHLMWNAVLGLARNFIAISSLSDKNKWLVVYASCIEKYMCVLCIPVNMKKYLNERVWEREREWWKVSETSNFNINGLDVAWSTLFGISVIAHIRDMLLHSLKSPSFINVFVVVEVMYMIVAFFNISREWTGELMLKTFTLKQWYVFCF